MVTLDNIRTGVVRSLDDWCRHVIVTLGDDRVVR
jgi:hypothetical protein